MNARMPHGPTPSEPFFAQLTDMMAQSLGMLHDQQQSFQEETREQFSDLKTVVQAEFVAVRADMTALNIRMKDTCDKGQKDHRQYEKAIRGIQQYLSNRREREQGRRDVLHWAWNGFSWVFDNGTKLAAAAAFILAFGTAVRVFLWPPVTDATAEQSVIYVPEPAVQAEYVAIPPEDPYRHPVELRGSLK